MSLLLTLLAVLIGIIVIQGSITMLAAWGITGRRPALGAVIKALLLSVLAYAGTALLMAFQMDVLQGLGLPSLLVMVVVVLSPLLMSCWVFARCLDINLLQAFAINLVVGVIYLLLAIFGASELPPLQEEWRHSQFASQLLMPGARHV